MFWQLRLVRGGMFSLVFALLAAGVGSAQAAHKSAPELLPENTLVMVRVSNTPELIEKFQQTALGRIGLDEDIKPLVSQLYGAAR